MNKLLILCLALCAALAALPFSSANVCTDDIATWTKNQLQHYLDKYNVPYPKDSDASSLATIVKYYKDAAVTNAALFGDKVDQIVDKVKMDLHTTKDVSQDRADALVSELRHGLRTLELQGELSREKVSQALDRMRYQAIQNKIATEAQWRDLVHQVTSSFPGQSLYQKVLRKTPSDPVASASIDRWLQNLSDRLRSQKAYTEQQISDVVERVRAAVAHTDMSLWGDKHWLKQLEHNIEHHAGLTRSQLDALVNDIEREVNAFKIFAMDYAGRVVQDTQQWKDDVVDDIKDKEAQTTNAIHRWMDTLGDLVHQLWVRLSAQQTQVKESGNEAYATIHHAASTIVDNWSSSADAATASVSSVYAQATDMANDWQSSFADFWHRMQSEAFRRVGYTEAQITWVRRYLSKAFADQKAITAADVDRVLQNIKHYLQRAQVQSQAEVQRLIDHIRLSLEDWMHHRLQ